MVEDYIIKQHAVFDYINREYDGSDIINKKVYYNILLDDKARLYESYLILDKFLKEFVKSIDK